ncbi:nucleotidyltransferase family protein [Pediococcus argentinicus]|uniref:Nucleotidyltransferase family protein n=1 Tax=Pediococcus argentinicus TaxID=480391 RepID=A0A0R2N8E8_9LACO|nr:nucleotidyltransferase family protein [Pediococcus argentinicus]KRO22004.1 hypothetical protein IV88_GL001323 [Pediococcus argentinicus]NKZ23087.1 nucleotidyltransferase family protein [Pediococcus argentinicus]GEP20240.1 hypothetical protein LSA03_16240 [Pediococcus argentinicus]
MKYLNDLKKIISDNEELMKALRVVKKADLKQGCIAAGAIRNLVWSQLMQQEIPGLHDVDVVFFDPSKTYSDNKKIQDALKLEYSALNWEVKNEFYMNTHNNKETPKFKSVEDAIAHFTETATAVGAYLDDDNQLEIIAPYGLDDLFELKLRPTPYFENDQSVFIKRVESKEWTNKWSQLKLIYN